MLFLKENIVIAKRYRLTEQIGGSNFSVVWKAIDQKLSENNFVVIKIYEPERGLEQLFIELFRKEYFNTINLNHPNILSANHFDVYQKSPFLIFPFLEKGSARKKMKRKGVFSEEELLKVIDDIGQALSYLHQMKQPIIHQDLNPDNILIDDQNRYILSDFGISTKFKESYQLTLGKEFMFTKPYAPPEKFGLKPQVTPAIDIFALGVTIFELGTSEVPWNGEGGLALLKGEPVPLLPDTFSNDFIQMINSMLNKDSSLRPTIFEILEYTKKRLSINRASILNSDSSSEINQSITANDTSIITNRESLYKRFFELSNSKKFLIYGLPILIIFIMLIILFNIRKEQPPSAKSTSNNFVEKSYSQNTLDSNEIFKSNGSINSTPAIFESNIYFGSEDCYFYALDINNKNEIWKYKTDGYVESSPIVKDGTVYFGSKDNNFYALDARTGKPKWIFSSGSAIESSPLLYDSKIFIGNDNGVLNALDEKTGNLIWNIKVKDKIFCKPVISKNVIYFGSLDSIFYAVNLKTRSIIWAFRTGDQIFSSPVINNETIFFGCNDGFLYAVNTEGKLKWKFESTSPILSSPTIYNNTLYFGNSGGNLFALDIRNGNQKMETFKTNDQIISSPINSNDMLLFGSLDSNLYVINAKTNKLIKSIKLNGAIYCTPTVVGNNIYIGCNSGYLYSLK